MAPIFLNYSPATQASDEAGIIITKRVLPVYNVGPYTDTLLPNHMKRPEALDYVPPLEYFCVKSLVSNVDLIDLGGLARLQYHPTSQMGLLKGLIQFFESDMRETDMRYVDPRLWGTLIQLYSQLPPCFITYTLPLADTHLTQLQAIRSTPDFTLITVLDLASCTALTDDTIGQLKPLTNLCVLDLSGTAIGSWGLRKLSMCLVGNGDRRIGPWGLRILSLQGCTQIDDTVKDALIRFPLLCAVDLRYTSVRPSSPLPGFTSRPPTSHNGFYHPDPPLSWITGMTHSFPDCQIFESTSEAPPHVLHINKLEHPRPKLLNEHAAFSGLSVGSLQRHNASSVGEQDRVLALFPDGRQSLHTTHGLSQAAEQKTLLRKQLEELRRVKRQHFDPSDYDIEGRDFKGDGSEGDLFEDEGSEDENSEDERSESEVYSHDESPFDLAHTGGPYGADSDDPDTTTAKRLLQAMSQQNELEAAARVTERHAAEQEAYRFYRTGVIPGSEAALRLRGGAPDAFPSGSRGHATNQDRVSASQYLRQRPDQSANRSDATAPRQTRKPTRDDRQRSLMFFRTPPPFNAILDDGGTNKSLRRRNPDEVILTKRRKTEGESSGLPKMLLDRLSRGSRNGSRDILTVQRTEVKAVSGVHSRQYTDPRSRPVSMNPFLAKKKSFSTQPNTSSCRVPSISGLSTAASLPRTPGITKHGLIASTARSDRTSAPQLPRFSSRPSSLPAMFAAAVSRPICTALPEKVTSEKTEQRPFGQGELPATTSTKRRQKEAFDIKAWATKTKR